MLVELSCQPVPKKAARKEYRLNSKKLVPYQSQQIINHSPEGFGHGPEEKGPAQLALAICLELFGRRPAVHIYHQFKRRHLAKLSQETFTVWLDVSEDAEQAREYGYQPK